MDARMARWNALLQAGRIAEADIALEETAASLRSGGWGEAAFFCNRMRAQRRFLDGHFEEAEQRWKEVFKQAVRAGISYAELMRGAQQIELELEREGPKAVVEKRLRVMSAMQKIARPVRAGMARIAAQAGELDLVRAHLATLGEPTDFPRDGNYLHGLASLAVCFVALEDKARCEQLLGLLEPYADLNTPDSVGYYIGSVSYFLGLLTGALGKNAKAQAYFERALKHNRAMGYRAGVVRTCMSHAQLAQRVGDADHARQLLQDARTEAHAIGMHSAAADAEAALAGL
jgi:tetratricopeptide (TPR) repeat protein